LLSIPEVLLRCIRLRLLPLLLLGREALGFLRSSGVRVARRAGTLAAGEEADAGNQTNYLNVLHTCPNISSKSEKPVRLGPKLETNSK
jgi:hypothetical protein